MLKPIDLDISFEHPFRARIHESQWKSVSFRQDQMDRNAQYRGVLFPGEYNDTILYYNMSHYYYTILMLNNPPQKLSSSKIV